MGEGVQERTIAEGEQQVMLDTGEAIWSGESFKRSDSSRAVAECLGFSTDRSSIPSTASLSWRFLYCFRQDSLLKFFIHLRTSASALSATLPTMATMTMTAPPQTKKKNVKLPPENERYMRACSDIANALIQEYESEKDPLKPKKDINLNKLRGQLAKKHSLGNQPPLTAIISAVPEHYKKYILPKLIAKPISLLPLPAS